MGIEAVTIGTVIQRVLGDDPSACGLATARARLDDIRRIDAFFAARAAAYRSSYERLMAEAASTPPEHHREPEPAADLDLGLPPLPPLSTREARRHELQAKWLARCGLFAKALSSGKVSPALVDTLASVLDPLEATVVAHLLGDEARLLRLASRSTPDGFRSILRTLIDQARADFGERALERQHKDSKASTWIDHETGMYRLSVSLDPQRGQVLFAAIDQRIGELRNQPSELARSEGALRLQAVIDLIGGTATVIPEVLVVVDERTVRSGPHPESVCETEAGVPLPPSVAIDLCTHAKVTAAIVDADGRTVALGCAARTATREQRRALRAMYRTCAHPDCDAPFTECEMHHVVHWEHGGPTALPNLVPLCFRHHHLVHEGGWQLTIGADRTLHWHRPDGTTERFTPLQPLHRPSSPRPTDDEQRSDSVDTGGSPPGRAPPKRCDPRAA